MWTGQALTKCSLTLASRLKEINRATDHVRSFCQSVHLDESAAKVLSLILEELITNTVRHGAPPPDAPITVTLSRDGLDTLVQYVDCGPAYDPTLNPPPDTRDRPLEERPIGGLGWTLIFHYCEGGPISTRG